MSLGKAIFSILTNDGTVSGLVGTKVYPQVANQSESTPLVTYEFVGIDPTNTKDGASELDQAHFVVDLYTSTYTELQDLSSAVRSALDRYTGTVESVVIDKIIFENYSDSFDENAKEYRATLNFKLREKR